MFPAEAKDRPPVESTPAERTPLPVAAPADKSIAPTAPITINGSGEYVDVTYGDEMYSPFEFQHYRVGPFNARVHLAVGETHAEAAHRGLAMLAAIADEERPKKRAAFLKHVGKA
jgi:hypothetical protein